MVFSVPKFRQKTVFSRRLLIGTGYKINEFTRLRNKKNKRSSEVVSAPMHILTINISNISIRNYIPDKHLLGRHVGFLDIKFAWLRDEEIVKRVLD
ncbi:MAG: hypothetical protein LBF13_00360 [Campylobacteraceae bacterium]|nr:hypothetical protein [Campylobacteraceae bacterium]